MPSSNSIRAFALKLALLCLPFIAAGFWLELRMRALPTSYSQKRAGFIQTAPDLEVLVLGASEVLQGVDASALGEHAYNMANVGQSFYYDQKLMAWAMKKTPKLRQVLLGVSYQSLAYQLTGTEEAWRSVAYFKEYGITPDEGLRGLDLRYLSSLLFYEPIPSLRWVFTGKGFDSPALTPSGQDRLKCFPEDEVDVRVNALTAAHRGATHEALIHLEFIDSNLAQLKIMAELAAAHKLALTLFLPPVTRSYAEAINAQRRGLMLEKLRAFCSAHGLVLKDYFQDPRFQDKDFFDVDHLCEAGSRKFSAILARDTSSLDR